MLATPKAAEVRQAARPQLLVWVYMQCTTRTSSGEMIYVQSLFRKIIIIIIITHLYFFFFLSFIWSEVFGTRQSLPSLQLDYIEPDGRGGRK